MPNLSLISLRNYLPVFTLFIFAGSCATPIAPTGGQPDRTGPVVVRTYPEPGTTNFDDNEVSFTFDKFVDRNSFRQNVSVEPDLGIEFETSFRRRTATVSFTSPLPENTTVIVKVGTDVTDTNRNSMAGSFDLPLSTGDVLDDSRVTTRILDAETGTGESGKRVFLYREPVDFTSRANYVAQTDTSGRIEFGYLSAGVYRAIWIDDQNRNRIWDRNREAAQPFSLEFFELERGQEIDLGTLYVSMPDTVAPRIEGVGLLTERMLRLRLSEEVQWDFNSFLTVTDTLENEITRAYPLNTSATDPEVLFAQSEEALSESEFFTLVPQNLTDFAGNALRVDFAPFQGSSQQDTTALRTVSHNAGSGLFPDEAIEINYSKFIDDNAVLDSLLVFEGDVMHSDWEAVETDRHILRIHPPDGLWQSGIRYQFRVWNPWEVEHEQIEPEIWQRNQLGSIEIEMENDDPDILNHLRLTDRDFSILVDTTFTGSVLVDNLPPLEYQAIVFQDVDGNGRWDPGTIDPYTKPEPYVIRRSIPVREGFTSEVEMSFPVKSEITDIEVEPEDSETDDPEN